MRDARLSWTLIVPLLAMTACSATTSYLTDSRAADREISIDGKSDDWVGELSIIADGMAEEGFLNDGNFLYICFVTEDEFLRREIARGGFTVWFDPKGGDEKVLGIKYPLGTPRPERAKPAEAQAAPPQEEPADADASSFEVLRSGGASPQTLKISEARGIEVATSPGGGLFVYELKIPLQASADQPIALGAAPGAKISVGLEVRKLSGDQAGGRPSGGMGGRGGGIGGGVGGIGGIGGGRGRMRGGMAGRGMQAETMNGLNVWTYVKLAASKMAAPARPVY